MQGTRNRLTIAICSALAAGALVSAGAIAHDVEKSEASTTTAPVTGNASSTSTMDKDRIMEADQSRTRSAQGGANAQGTDDVVWFVVPVALENQSSQASNGCWVKLYSGDNFEGRHVMIVGPTGIRELRSPYGTGLNNWESAVVGPNATVTTFDDEGFRARNATLRGGQRYPDMSDSKLGLFEDIESIKVACSNVAGSGSGS